MNSKTEAAMLANLALNPACRIEDIYSLGAWIRGGLGASYLPRWEEVRGGLEAPLLEGLDYGFDISEPLPTFCFNCLTSSHRLHPGGGIRESCRYCKGDRSFRDHTLPIYLFGLHAITGYEENYFKYLMLKEMKRRLRS